MKLSVNTVLALVEQQVGSTAQEHFGSKAWLRRLRQVQDVAAKTPSIGLIEVKLPTPRRRRRTTKKKSHSAQKPIDVTTPKGRVPLKGEQQDGPQSHANDQRDPVLGGSVGQSEGSGGKVPGD